MFINNVIMKAIVLFGLLLILLGVILLLTEVVYYSNKFEQSFRFRFQK